MKVSKFFKVLIIVALFATVAGAREGGETGKGGVPSAGDLFGYCDSAVSVLVRAKRIAREKFADGDLTGARQTLVSGLVRALKNFNNVNSDYSPLMKNAIARGLDLDSSFQNGCSAGSEPGCANLETRSALSFLGRYYDYILRVVAELDHQYYVPYMSRYHFCHDYSCLPPDFGDEFFIAYKDSSASLLNFYNGDNPQSGLPDTLAKDVYELSVAEKIMGWAAEDLNQDLWRRNFACVIDELSESSQDLADFNAGDTQRFSNSRRAVLFARDEAQSVANILNESNSCVIYPRWR